MRVTMSPIVEPASSVSSLRVTILKPPEFSTDLLTAIRLHALCFLDEMEHARRSR